MRLLGALLAIMAFTLAVSEVTMRPSPADRLDLALLIGGLIGGTSLVAWVAQGWLRRSASLRLTVLVVALAAAGVTLAGFAVTSALMFVSSHDARLLTVILVLSAGLAVVVSVAVAEPLTSDLGKLARTAASVAAGDLAAQTGIDRPDELGITARAVDAMIAELREVEQQRARLERERQELLAGLGHDLRTPLTALNAAVEALQDGVASDPERYLAAMRRDLEALGHLVEDLFLLARLEAGGLELAEDTVDLVELADEAVEALEPLAARKEILVAVRPDGAVGVVGGAPELRRVIRNLLDNAIRHSPPGGEVVVEVTRADGAAEVRVVDPGPGFPDDFRDRAFERFSRPEPARDRERGGAGLGLAIARGVVEAHRGTIWIEPGPGGRVAFRLPVQERDVARRAPA
ncbi:MAG: sensor histidine kinase [Nitriliruptorales bacterium]